MCGELDIKNSVADCVHAFFGIGSEVSGVTMGPIVITKLNIPERQRKELDCLYADMMHFSGKGEKR